MTQSIKGITALVIGLASAMPAFAQQQVLNLYSARHY